jgi:hypothetical protein
MSNTYTWLIDSLNCIPSADGQSNVVSTVHWRVNVVSNQGKTIKLLDKTTQIVPYTATKYGSQTLTFDAKNAFIAYDSLTKDTVVGWVQEAMGIDAVTKLQETLDKQLETLVNPPVITPPLPWTG